MTLVLCSISIIEKHRTATLLLFAELSLDSENGFLEELSVGLLVGSPGGVPSWKCSQSFELREGRGGHAIHRFDELSWVRGGQQNTLYPFFSFAFPFLLLPFFLFSFHFKLREGLSDSEGLPPDGRMGVEEVSVEVPNVGHRLQRFLVRH